MLICQFSDSMIDDIIFQYLTIQCVTMNIAETKQRYCVSLFFQTVCQRSWAV